MHRSSANHFVHLRRRCRVRATSGTSFWHLFFSRVEPLVPAGVYRPFPVPTSHFPPPSPPFSVPLSNGAPTWYLVGECAVPLGTPRYIRGTCRFIEVAVARSWDRKIPPLATALVSSPRRVGGVAAFNPASVILRLKIGQPHSCRGQRRITRRLAPARSPIERARSGGTFRSCACACARCT